MRDHYVRAVLGEDPFAVRREDPERYLDLGRAAVCAAVAEVFTWWRRPRSGCGGGLVLAALDLRAGAGWGLLDVDRGPKAPWHVLRRVLAPVAVLLSDDGLDGVGLDLLNDTGSVVEGVLTVRAHRGDGVVEDLVERPVTVPARGAWSASVDELTTRFLDLTHAYRFGPRSWEAVSATLHSAGPERCQLAAATALLGGDARSRESDVGLETSLAVEDERTWRLVVRTRATAQWVVVDAPGFDASDSWFHMASSTERVITLTPSLGRLGAGSLGGPRGRVRALNSSMTVGFGGLR